MNNCPFYRRQFSYFMAFDEISDKKFSIENLNIKVFEELNLNHTLCLMDKIIKKVPNDRNLKNYFYIFQRSGIFHSLDQ